MFDQLLNERDKSHSVIFGHIAFEMIRQRSAVGEAVGIGEYAKFFLVFFRLLECCLDTNKSHFHAAGLAFPSLRRVLLQGFFSVGKKSKPPSMLRIFDLATVICSLFAHAVAD